MFLMNEENLTFGQQFPHWMYKGLKMNITIQKYSPLIMLATVLQVTSSSPLMSK